MTQGILHFHGRGDAVQTDPLGLSGKVLLGRYRVDSALAQGGMSVIYRGHDMRMLRAVCIKVFHRLSRTDAAYRTSYEHFVQEAFALSQLCHPNTLRIYDFGHLDDDGQAPFQVSEMLEGGTLAQWVRREGPRQPVEALEILEAVCGSLVEAHARGIVHRDVKPSNVMLALLGTRRVAKLGDFGIAKVVADDATLPMRAGDTMASAGQPIFLFSPGWAAPEQIRGEKPSPATDVFSLGLVTAFLLAGHGLFSNNDALSEGAQRADSDGHVAAMVARLGFSPAVQEVLRTACRAAPSARYPSVEDFLVALRAALMGTDREQGSSPWNQLVAEACPLPSGSLLLPLDSLEEAPISLAVATGHASLSTRKELTRNVVECLGDRETLIEERRLNVVGVAGTGELELGGSDVRFASKARFRLTFLPSHGPTPRVNLKGLNCFVKRLGGRASAAVDIEGDAQLELVWPDQKRIELLRLTMGKDVTGRRLYEMGPLQFLLEGAEAGAVLIEGSAARELVLVHRETARVLGEAARD
jgi:serine/threonine protein kinase